MCYGFSRLTPNSVRFPYSVTAFIGARGRVLSEFFEEVRIKTQKESTAILSHKGKYTIFSFSGRRICFRTSEALERYTKIVHWNHGYLVVMAKYKTWSEVEEYIDLLPILENLYMDPEEFLAPIQNVRIQYDEESPISQSA